MRGRGLALVAGARMGQARAQQQYEQQAQVQEAQQQAAAAQQQAAAPATDTTAELKKLADLHEQGILTDEEFAASKKKLLGL
ncbi:MAG TPA: SHOCT domain-containing protein [Candidatus Bathyarchaeia archaeon]|nr:SHOCT domain-containing protein [Candidatus Bathyarchaeia archaeon]